MSKIGKRQITISVVYTSDYTKGIASVDVEASSSDPKEMVEFPTVVGILEMAKEKFSKGMGI